MKIRTSDAPRTAHIGLLALLIALLAGGLFVDARQADASAVQQAGPSAVAVVDLTRLLDGLDERAALEQELNQEIEQRQAELDRVTGAIERMGQDIQTLAEDDPNRTQRIRELRMKEIEARALRNFIQEELSLEKGRMLGNLFNKIQNSVADIAARDGWDLVLIDDSSLELPSQVNEQQMLQLVLSRRVLAAGERVDITDDVRTLMNNRFNAAQ
jgi:Skp family chaperone for outer membrane proteins